MEEASYLLEKEFNFLPEQHFIIYAVKIKDKRIICNVAK